VRLHRVERSGHALKRARTVVEHEAREPAIDVGPLCQLLTLSRVASSFGEFHMILLARLRALFETSGRSVKAATVSRARASDVPAGSWRDLRVPSGSVIQTR